VVTGGGDLEGPSGDFLSADIREVGDHSGGEARAFGRADGGRRLALKRVEHLAQVRHRYDVAGAAHDSGLLGVLARHEHALHGPGAGEGGHRQDSLHRANGTVERQLADEQRAVDGIGGEQSRAAQDPDGDGDVVGGAVLAQIGGGQVHHDLARGHLDAGVLEGAPDPGAPLLHPGVSQADDLEARQAGGDVDLDVDGRGLDAGDGGGEDAGEHGREECERNATGKWHLRAGRIRVSVRSCP
jgi:hypothetical protein